MTEDTVQETAKKTYRVIDRVSFNVNPKNLQPPREGPIRFPVARNKAVPVSKNKSGGDRAPELEIHGPWLTPGRNEVSKDEYDAMAAHPDFETCITLGVIEPFMPLATVERLTGRTVDYGAQDALKLIQNSEDVTWLKECQAAESGTEREMVRSAIRRRITDIEKKLTSRTAALKNESSFAN